MASSVPAVGHGGALGTSGGPRGPAVPLAGPDRRGRCRAAANLGPYARGSVRQGARPRDLAGLPLAPGRPGSGGIGGSPKLRRTLLRLVQPYQASWNRPGCLRRRRRQTSPIRSPHRSVRERGVATRTPAPSRAAARSRPSARRRSSRDLAGLWPDRSGAPGAPHAYPAVRSHGPRRRCAGATSLPCFVHAHPFRRALPARAATALPCAAALRGRRRTGVRRPRRSTRGPAQRRVRLASRHSRERAVRCGRQPVRSPTRRRSGVRLQRVALACTRRATPPLRARVLRRQAGADGWSAARSTCRDRRLWVLAPGRPVPHRIRGRCRRKGASAQPRGERGNPGPPPRHRGAHRGFRSAGSSAGRPPDRFRGRSVP